MNQKINISGGKFIKSKIGDNRKKNKNKNKKKNDKSFFKKMIIKIITGLGLGFLL